MKIKLTAFFGAAAALALSAVVAQAQTTLKWAHVYETSEPFHTESVWAAEEIGKRTDGRYKIDVFPASQLGKEADINQGLKLGTVDIIISGSSFAARDYKPIGVTYFPYIFSGPDHLIALPKAMFSSVWLPDTKKRAAIISRRSAITVHVTPLPTSPSPNAPTWPV